MAEDGATSEWPRALAAALRGMALLIAGGDSAVANAMDALSHADQK